MKKYMQILAYLITLLARRVNPKIKYGYLGDSIGWGFGFVNLWISIVVYELIVASIYPDFIKQFTLGKIMNPIILTVALLMIIEFFVFFSKDQWRVFIPEIERMDRTKRRRLCWQVIWFFIISIPLSIIWLVLKYPMLTTWTG